MLRYISIVFIAIALGSVAQAQDRYETNTLFQKGTWTVSITYDNYDGLFWCDASTSNRQSQELALTLYETGLFTIFVFDPRWNISPRPLRFLIDVDYSRWKMDGEGDGVSISITPENGDKAAKFTREVMEGTAVALMNADGRRLGTFSLSGSYAAVLNLFECYDRIGKSDPFSDSDPFRGANDPF